MGDPMENRMKHGSIFIHRQERGFQLSLTDAPVPPSRAVNVSLAVASMRDAVSAVTRSTHNGTLQKESEQTRADGLNVTYHFSRAPLAVTAEVTLPAGVEAVCQRTSVRNLGDQPVRLTQLACANVTGIGLDGTPWYQCDRFVLHYCTSQWLTEGQWKSSPLRALGLMPASGHDFEMHAFRIQSCGSWSTGEYYPLLILEDREKGECHFFEREGAENWFMELRACGGGDRELTVCIGGADESLGWVYELPAGQTYTSAKAVYGVVRGGFESAVRALTDYKRRDSAVPPAVKVTFNNYMNCCWAQPDAQRLLPLIDRAAALGAQRFCIDDGWAVPGTWDPLEEKFGAYGFDGIIRCIREKGMEAGVWFEFERSNPAVAAQFDDDFVERRNGVVLGDESPKLNLRSAQAREYLLRKIDRVYRAGVRYIKNDHNSSEGLGANMAGESPAEGLVRKRQAFEAFFDEVYARYPDLTIENCASGAMRCDHGTLRQFALQSLSDQEDYRLFPSILIGQLACMPPEKAGVWSYPCPCPFENLPSLELTEAQLASQNGGRQTVYNMVSAMMGHLYLSGRIDLADELNTALIREAIGIYRTYMDTIAHRYPIFPAGRKPFYDRTFHALGLAGADDLLLAVWARAQRQITLSADALGCAAETAEVLYPSVHPDVALSCNEGALSLSFRQEDSAVLLRLRRAGKPEKEGRP